MVLPTKYLPLHESYIAIAGLILSVLGDKSLHLDALWQNYTSANIDNPSLIPSYIKFVYVVTFMSSYGMISYNEGGEVFNENLKLKDI